MWVELQSGDNYLVREGTSFCSTKVPLQACFTPFPQLLPVPAPFFLLVEEEMGETLRKARESTGPDNSQPVWP